MNKMLSLGLLLTMSVPAISGMLAVNPTGKHQTIEGIGAALSMCEGFITGQKYKEELYDTLFKATGISILRFGNWLQDTTSDLTTDSTLAAEYRKRNPYGKVLISSWTPPKYLKGNNSETGSTSPNSLKKVNGKFVYDQFGHWWKTTVNRFNRAGINPDYITIQNEINWNTDYGSCLFQDYENDTIAAYAPAMKAVHDSIRTLTKYPKLLGPEVLGTGYDGVEWAAKTMTDSSAFEGWAFHFYGSGDFNDPPSFLNNTMTGASFSKLKKATGGKPRFMTEFCNLGSHETDAMSLASPDTAKDWLNLGWIMQEAFVEADLNGWVFWDMAWQGNSSMVATLAPWDPNSWPASAPHGFFVRRMLPALGQYSRFVKPGWIRIDATPMDTALKVSAFLSPQGDSVSIIIVNPGFSSVGFTPMVVSSSVAEGSVWVTSPTMALNNTGTWKSGQDLVAAPRSITTLSGSMGLAVPAVLGAQFFQYSGYSGLSAKLKEGDYTLSQLQTAGIPDNSISSMKVDPGMTVELFDGDNFTSRLGVYTSDLSDFSTVGMGNKVTSIRITSGTVGIQSRLTVTNPQMKWLNNTLHVSGVQSGQLYVRGVDGALSVIPVRNGIANTKDLKAGKYLMGIDQKHMEPVFVIR